MEVSVMTLLVVGGEERERERCLGEGERKREDREGR